MKAFYFKSIISGVFSFLLISGIAIKISFEYYKIFLEMKITQVVMTVLLIPLVFILFQCKRASLKSPQYFFCVLFLTEIFCFLITGNILVTI
jgi:hypothetical protein